MIAKNKEREKAILLRKQGLSYSEILERLPVAKGSLSLWIRHVELSKNQRKRLMEKAQGAGGRARHKQRLFRLGELEKEISQEIPGLLKDPFFLFGLALYWAEGTKTKPWRIAGRVQICNSDENLLLVMRRWCMKYSSSSINDFIYRLYIHETADAFRARKVWAKILAIPEESIGISFKRNKIKGRDINIEYKGLVAMNLRRSTWFLRRIDLWTKHAARFYM